MKKYIVYVVGCFILWGILPVFWKLLKAVDSVYVLASRIVWSMIFAVLLVLLTKRGISLKAAFQDKKQLFQSCLCGIFITINWGFYIVAVNSGHIVDASLAYYMNPLLSVGIGFFVFHEKLSKRKWIACLIALSGILYSVVEYGAIPYLSLIIGGSFAIYGALKKKIHYDASISLFIETLAITPVALIYILFCESQNAGCIGILHGWEYLLLPASGIITAIPLFLYAKGIPHVPYSLSGILMYLNPTLQLSIGVLLYKEQFTKSNLIMFVCVWTALILFVTDKAKS